MARAATAARMKLEAELYAQRIDETNELQDPIILEYGPVFGSGLELALVKRGWERKELVNGGSKAATFEARVGKERRLLHIACSVLHGEFTLIEVLNP